MRVCGQRGLLAEVLGRHGVCRKNRWWVESVGKEGGEGGGGGGEDHQVTVTSH